MPPTGLVLASRVALLQGALLAVGEPAGERPLSLTTTLGRPNLAALAAKIEPVGQEQGGLLDRDRLHPGHEVEDVSARLTAPKAVEGTLRERDDELLGMGALVDRAGATEAARRALKGSEHAVVIEDGLEGDGRLHRPEVDPS